jgi:hypothetical protein
MKSTKKKVEFSLDSIQNNSVTRQQLEGFVEELVGFKRVIITQQSSIKDARNEAKDSLGIPGKILMKLVRESMDPGTLEAEAHEIEEVQALAAAIENDGKPAP